MDLNEVLMFTKVVETKSFTAAADALGVPKSTVSRKLAQLEERLGVRLVQRTTRKLSLTDVGQAYYDRIRSVILDIAAAEGTPVSAAGGAKVVFAGEMKFYGNTVILDHGLGLFSFYNHMSVIYVEEGQMVAKGDKIGEVGTTGYSTGPHLHWNIRLFETNVDPALFTKENSIISDMKRMMSE